MINLIWLIPVSIILSYVVNYFADIMPLGRGLEKYQCKQCSQPYTFSAYLRFLPCPNCKKKISPRHWVVLGLSILATVFLFLFPPGKSASMQGFTYVYIALFFYFMLVFIIDLEHREILYFLSFLGMIACIVVGVWLHQDTVNILSLANKPFYNGLANTVLGVLVGAGIMFALYLLGLLFSVIVTRIRKEKVAEVALGFGDVIMAAILGSLLGYPGIYGCLILAILLGGLFSLVYIIVMKIKGKFQALTAIPYAPFLIISAMGLLYFAK